MMNLRNFVFLVLLAFFYLQQSFAIDQDTTLTLTSEVYEKESQFKVLLHRRSQAESTTASSDVTISKAQYAEFCQQPSRPTPHKVASPQIAPAIADG